MDITIVIPVYRSAAMLCMLVERIEALAARISPHIELILVDDNSPDDSWQVATELAKQHSRITCIRLMRNFGQHNALMCGFHHASGQIVVTMDDDLQHEPESIPRLLDRLQETGADLVYGVYDQKRHGRGRNLGSWLVTRFYRLVFKVPIAPTSFRAMRGELVDAILRYDLNFTYIDGLLAWNTQRIDKVTVPHHERADGKSGYTIGKLVNLAMNVFTNFSLLPLQLVSLVGFAAAALGLTTGLYYVVRFLQNGIGVPGYASTIVSVLVLGGIQLLSLGIIGEYLGRLHLNVNRKPQFTIRTVFSTAISSNAAAFFANHESPSLPLDEAQTGDTLLERSR